MLVLHQQLIIIYDMEIMKRKYEVLWNLNSQFFSMASMQQELPIKILNVFNKMYCENTTKNNIFADLLFIDLPFTLIDVHALVSNIYG